MFLNEKGERMGKKKQNTSTVTQTYNLTLSGPPLLPLS